MTKTNKKIQPALIISTAFLILVIFAELLAIMILNDGKLVYTLDDPYIHLAVSENIAQGHYGVNANEFSSPSSSIIWPFILAPFASLAWFPLLLNTFAAIMTLYIFTRILNLSLPLNAQHRKQVLITGILISLILGTNLVGLIFTGMEHSWQTLLAAVMVYGMLLESEQEAVKIWLVIAIVAAPLIRYENAAISTAAIFYLALRGHPKKAGFAAAGTVLGLVGFSLFLKSLGLGFFPASVTVKTAVVGSHNLLSSVLKNMLNTFIYRQGLLLMLGLLIIISHLIFRKQTNPHKKPLELATVLAIGLHIMFGRYDWYHRYEIYIWTFFLLISLYLLGPSINTLFEKAKKQGDYGKVLIIIIVGFLLFTGANYIQSLFTLPIASNNIYEQHYQMHRFVVNYYQQPVAVNDLGYVSYQNDHYVLDLWGLGSLRAYQARKQQQDSAWMQDLVQENDVDLAIIYDESFQYIPDEWVKIGELHLGKKQITPAYDDVSFFSTTPQAYSSILEKLQPFIKELPAEVEFSYNSQVD